MNNHNLSYIHPNAKIGDDTVISPFSYIYEDVVIGKNCWIGPNVVIMNGAVIGDNCKIFPGAVISAIPQDLKYNNENTKTIIGNNTTIRECVTINKGTVESYKTEVGNNCLLMAYVHVGHDTIIGNNCVIANSVNIAGHVKIEDWVVIEGVVGIQQFVKIGKHSFIAGYSKVRQNVPPYISVAKEPLAYIGINNIGMKRRNMEDDKILLIERVYKQLFRNNTTIKKGIEELESTYFDNQIVEEIIDFIKKSEKGIIKRQ